MIQDPSRIAVSVVEERWMLSVTEEMFVVALEKAIEELAQKALPGGPHPCRGLD